MTLNEYMVLEDEQQVWVRLSWCYVIRAKLCRSNINEGNNQDLWEIVNKTIDFVNINPITNERYVPSLHVPQYGLMTIGNIKKILNIYGTTLFDCHLQDDNKHFIEPIFTKENGSVLVKKLIRSKSTDNNK